MCHCFYLGGAVAWPDEAGEGTAVVCLISCPVVSLCPSDGPHVGSFHSLLGAEGQEPLRRSLPVGTCHSDIGGAGDRSTKAS